MVRIKNKSKKVWINNPRDDVLINFLLDTIIRQICYLAQNLPLMSKKIAVIDLGTNTFHLLIAEISDQDKLNVKHQEKVSVKIGEGGINEGIITTAAEKRAITTIQAFRQTIDNYGIEDAIFATATSAIRSARNGKELTDKIAATTGIKVRIISGDQEAQYIYEGVKEAVEIGRETSLIMDIGGGSVEFIICNQDEVFWKQSFEIGAQRLLDLFHYHDPIIPIEIENLNMYLTDHLSTLISANLNFNPTVLIGSSGSFDTFSDMHQHATGTYGKEKSTEIPLSLESFLSIYNDIISKNREERLAMPGMIAMRVDMIVVAAILVKFILNSCHLSRIRVSSYSLKEGILFDILKNLKNDK